MYKYSSKGIEKDRQCFDLNIYYECNSKPNLIFFFIIGWLRYDGRDFSNKKDEFE